MCILRAGNESLKPCIVLVVRWSVKQLSVPNSPTFWIKLAENWKEEIEEHRQLESVMCFTQTN